MGELVLLTVSWNDRCSAVDNKKLQPKQKQVTVNRAIGFIFRLSLFPKLGPKLHVYFEIIVLYIFASTDGISLFIVSLSAQYYITTMVLVSASTVLTAIVLYIHHRGTYVGRAPSWFRRFTLDYLAKFMCMGDCHNPDVKYKVMVMF